MKTLKLFVVFFFLGTLLRAQNWITLNSGTDKYLESVFFTNEFIGYAVGEYGTILKTTDGGSQWIQQNSSSQCIINSVFFPDAATGYTVETCGWQGAISKSVDSGVYWNSSAFDYSMSSVFFTSKDTGYIVGAIGKIFKTTDGGTNWVQKVSNTTNNLISVFFTNTNTGYAVGESEKILKSSDGGETWVSMASGVQTGLFSVHFPEENIGYAVGPGAIVKTNDGGINWTIQDPGITGGFYSVYFINKDTGYVVGFEGIILRTNNGGIQWNVQISGTTQTLHSVYFTNEFTGYAVGSNGTILKTTTGVGFGIDDRTDPNQHLSVHPDPVKDFLSFISPNELTDVDFAIFNIKGQKVLTGKVKNAKSQIDLRMLETGMYFIRVTNNSINEIRKIIKE
jgi:photosystem II stability/assembly factor-like uncharacterized protein